MDKIVSSMYKKALTLEQVYKLRLNYKRNIIYLISATDLRWTGNGLGWLRSTYPISQAQELVDTSEVN